MCSPHLSTSEDIWKKAREEAGPGWWYCPSPRTAPWYDSNGEVFQQGKPCERNYCFHCVPHNVVKVERALHHVQPKVFITINDVGQDHAQGRAAMKAFRCHLRSKTRLKFEDLYVLERYVQRGHEGLGVHLYGHGDLPDETDVLRAAWAAGMDPERRDQPVDVQHVTHHGNLGYLFKSTKSEQTFARFLDDNGGGLMSTTRGFWRLPGHQPAPQGYKGLLRQVRGSASPALARA